jgi:acyl-CoA thioesterase-1
MVSIGVRTRLTVALACLLALAACRRAGPPAATQGAAERQAPALATPAPDEDARPRIVALGDSLTAGLGLLEAQAYPALLQQKIDQEGYSFAVVNAGVSGDTSAAGLARLDWALDGNVKVLIVELGANDGLRGLSPAEMKKNLAEIIERATARGIAVLLLGMEAPPNFGPEYAVSFRQVYRELARQYHVTFVPFMLDKVAGHGDLNQRDGIHPNIEGTRIVANTIWNALRPMLDAVSS